MSNLWICHQNLQKALLAVALQNVDFYVGPAFRVLVLPIKGFTAYYTAFNSSFRVSLETDSMGSPTK